ncbi:hypothetical protein ACSTD9_22130 [Vibrio vulnificus]|uniref:hypothetical protein n=1 Tax=Vibrio vulnificus TaxID=672 RepID=UPI003ED92D81
MFIEVKLDWFELISAAGVGAVTIKLLDIVWMQRVIRESEKKKWLREKRLAAYSKLTSEVLSLGREFQTREDVFKGYALAAEAMLLADNKRLAERIESHFTMISNLYKETTRDSSDPLKKSESELEGAYLLVINDSRSLAEELRKSLNK